MLFLPIWMIPAATKMYCIIDTNCSLFKKNFHHVPVKNHLKMPDFWSCLWEVTQLEPALLLSPHS